MLLPSIIALSITAISSGLIVSAVGYYTPPMLLGSTMMAVAFGFFTTFNPDTGRAAWVGWQVMFGLGMGLAIPQPWSAIQTALEAKDIPAGTAAVGFAISIGAALSTCVSQNVFTNLLRRGLSNVAGIDVEKTINQGPTNLSHSVPASKRGQVIDVYNFALTRTFWTCVAVTFLGMVAAIGMDWNSVKGVKEDAGGESTTAGVETEIVVDKNTTNEKDTGGQEGSGS